jgi:hypothetical protein
LQRQAVSLSLEPSCRSISDLSVQAYVGAVNLLSQHSAKQHDSPSHYKVPSSVSLQFLDGLSRCIQSLTLSPPSSRRFLSLFRYCINGKSTEPFGVDPVFLPTSSLFDANAVANIGSFYGPAEIASNEIPMGFYAEDTGKDDGGFPLVFDINLDQAGAQARLQMLADGLFLNNATESLFLQLVTYNGELVR